MVEYVTIALSMSLARYSMSASFKLGMLSPLQHPRHGWENNAAAATIAIEKAQKDGLLSEHNISVLWRDDSCNPLGGTTGAMMLKEADIDVFIGSACSGSTMSAGLLANYWNIPMFSQASSDPSLADKTVYKTLVRLGPPLNKMGKLFVELFKLYNWTRAVIISKRWNGNENVFCDHSSRSVQEAFRTNGIEIADLITIEDHLEDAVIDKVLDRAKQRGRIILLCTEIVDDRRRILLKAHTKGMTDGSYVFILPDLLPTSNIDRPWENHDGFDTIARHAFTSAFQVSVARPDVESFRDLVAEKMTEQPWFYNNTILSKLRGSEYSAFLYDAVYLYLLILNETLSKGDDHRNGTMMFERAKGKVFRGLTGNVKVDNNGDREPDYWVWDLVPNGDLFRVAMEISLISTNTERIHHLQSVVWETADGLAPPSTPRCGYSNELCLETKNDSTIPVVIVIVLGIVLTVITSAAAFFCYRRTKFARDLQLQVWKVHYEDIYFTKAKLTGSTSLVSLLSIGNGLSLGTTIANETQTYPKVGYFKDNKVSIKKLDVRCLTLQSEDILALKYMKEIHHENINVFVGLCVDERLPCLLTLYCNKGSLKGIIENDDLKLDWIFKVSLINDLTNGMAYIQSSPLHYHGNLKSSNCLVDNRWVLKIADYGLARIRNYNRSFLSATDDDFYSGMFWTAPELLDIETTQRSGCKDADIYAYGIILYEILYKTAPYNTGALSSQDIIQRVKDRQTPPFRPTSLMANRDSETDWNVDEKTTNGLKQLLDDCWSDSCSTRPPFHAIKHTIAKLNIGKKINIVDNMVMILEKYAVNLESLVQQRTGELLEEKRKTDSLLYRMLPPTVAENLKAGESVQAEVFESVTIYFSDIVGFTSLSSESTPMEVVDFLNDLYSAFDALIGLYDVYKVETIGDAYMVVSGLPVRNGSRHCQEIANMSLDLLDCASRFKILHKPGRKLQLRIGLHTGPCAAGVVGRTMPRYCLFGDTVNMASRMESTGQAMKIHVSVNVKVLLDQSNKFHLEPRGNTEIKGKGTHMTYWLISRRQLAETNSTNI